MSLRNRIRLQEGLVYSTHAYGRGPGRDPELLVRGVEPPTALELEGMAAMSVVDLQVFSHKMVSIVEEAREVYMALSISEGIITGDMNASLCTASGDPAVVASGIFFHSLLNSGPIKYAVKYYRDDPTMGLRDGDMFFFNDPTAGGVHSFDMFVAAPIFVGDTLVAWAQLGGHQGECGSISPGGFSPTAKSRWEEGMHVHMLRITDNWALRRDIFDHLLNSVRNPFVFASDLKARVATCQRMRDRVVREVERKGLARMAGGLRKILATSADLARQRLSELNDGIYRHIIFNDCNPEQPSLIRVPTTMIKEGDSMTVLVQGVSPENPNSPLNSTWHLTRASLGVYLFSYLFRGLPPNMGLFEPVRVLVEGPSLANCTDEVAHGEGTTVSAMAVQNLHVIGSKLLFDSAYREGVTAPFSRSVHIFVPSGVNAYGYRVANFTGAQNGAGQGARFDRDGEHSLGFYWACYTDTGEVEENDTRLPQTTLARTLDKDIHGFGCFRGGTPMVDISIAPPNGCSLTTRGADVHVSTNPGLFGGYSAPPNPRFVIYNTDIVDMMANSDPRLRFSQSYMAQAQPVAGDYKFSASSQATEPLKSGDVMFCNVGGGGGYGDVLRRDPAAVMEDLRSEIVSHHVARVVYGVVYDEASLIADLPATERRRQEMRKERLRRGKPFAEFTQEWSKKKPSEDKLKYYGHWPEPMVVAYQKPFWGLYD